MTYNTTPSSAGICPALFIGQNDKSIKDLYAVSKEDREFLSLEDAQQQLLPAEFLASQKRKEELQTENTLRWHHNRIDKMTKKDTVNAEYFHAGDLVWVQKNNKRGNKFCAVRTSAPTNVDVLPTHTSAIISEKGHPLRPLGENNQFHFDWEVQGHVQRDRWAQR